MAFTGKKFPDINVPAMDYLGDNLTINLLKEAQEKKQKVLLFWYPKDFTFVCPTELHAFQSKIEEFKKRNTMVIGASCDTNEVHFAWLSTPKNKGGIEGVEYPILSDSTRNLSSVLGILDLEYDEEEELIIGDNVTYRATYLIDEEGTVFHESINHMPLGRNVDEYLRIIDAYSHFQKNGEVCPANWKEGEKAMTANRDGVADYLSSK